MLPQYLVIRCWRKLIYNHIRTSVSLDAQQCTLGGSIQLRPPQPVFVENENFALFSKTEVRCASFHQDLAQKHSSRRPDIDAITTAAVHIAIHVALDAVREPIVRHGKQSSVHEERLARVIRHVERVTVSYRQSSRSSPLKSFSWLTSWRPASSPSTHPHASDLYP